MLACAWAGALTDDDGLFLPAALTKLQPWGKLVLVEDNPKTLERARGLALQAGLAVFSEPALFAGRAPGSSSHFVCVMQRPGRTGVANIG